MDALKFGFTIRGSADGKSNVLCLTSIGTLDGYSFIIPNEYQPINLHTELMKTQALAKIKKTLTKRHQSRKIVIKSSEELRKVYLDEELNLQFNEFFLEESVEIQPVAESVQKT